MDYRKDMRTPKDRVDDELLSRLLRETDELLEGCGCDSFHHSHGSRRSDRRNSERTNGRSCGCDRNDNSRRTGGSCGNDNGCGTRRNSARCSENTNDTNGFGCAGNDMDRRTGKTRGNDNGCGCASRRNTEGCCERSGDHHGTDHRDHEEEWGCVNRRSMSVQTQGLPLVMSYAPDHEFCDLHDDEEALKTGTLFHGLMFPFYGVRCDCSNHDRSNYGSSNHCDQEKKWDKNCGCGN